MPANPSACLPAGHHPDPGVSYAEPLLRLLLLERVPASLCKLLCVPALMHQPSCGGHTCPLRVTLSCCHAVSYS